MAQKPPSFGKAKGPFPAGAIDAREGEPDRDASGRVLPGNQLARKYPKVSAEDPLIQEQLADEAERVMADGGGRDSLSAVMQGSIEHFTVADLFLQSWEQFFLRSGIFTKHGRVRGGYVQGYLATLDRYMRLAQQIGLERRTRKVQSTRDWLMQETNETTETREDTK